MTEVIEIKNLEEIAENVGNDDLIAFFTEGEHVKQMIEVIRESVLEKAHDDVSSAKKRQELVSLAAKVRKVKSIIDGRGKELVGELKELPRKIDTSRKEIRDSLDTLAQDVRGPVTEWEEAKKKAEELEKKKKAEIERIKGLPGLAVGSSHSAIKNIIENMGLTTELFEGEELKEAEALVAEAMEKLKKLSAQAKAAEEAEELKKAQEQAKREDEIRKEEAEKAKQAAELAERRAKDREEQLMREAEEAKKRAEEESRLAVERAKEKEEREQKLKEADIKIKTAVAAKIVEALCAEGLDDKMARKVSQAMFRHRIPHIKVVY